MIIKIDTEEQLVHRGKTYFPDRESRIVLVPHDIVYGQDRYNWMVLRGLIRPEVKKKGFWSRSRRISGVFRKGRFGAETLSKT